MSNYFTRFCQLLLITGAACLMTLVSVTVKAQGKCDDLFTREKIEGAELLNTDESNPRATISHIWVDVDGVRVSGDSFIEIQANLNLDSAFLNHIKKENRSVLSLGEGVSDLVPTLLENGITATGLDIWYHTPDLKEDINPMAIRMQKYQSLYAAHLLRGSALNIPLKAESVDVVLANQVVNYFHYADQLKIISESVRVLNISGEARILLSHNRVPRREEKYFHTQLLEFIRESYGPAIDVRIDRNLLIINKLGTTKVIEPIDINFNPNFKYDQLPIGHRLHQLVQRQHLISSYEKTVAAINHRPDEVNLKWELKQIETKLKNDRQVELTQKSPFDKWLSGIKSRLSIKPERPTIGN